MSDCSSGLKKAWWFFITVQLRLFRWYCQTMLCKRFRANIQNKDFGFFYFIDLEHRKFSPYFVSSKATPWPNTMVKKPALPQACKASASKRHIKLDSLHFYKGCVSTSNSWIATVSLFRANESLLKSNVTLDPNVTLLHTSTAISCWKQINIKKNHWS